MASSASSLASKLDYLRRLIAEIADLATSVLDALYELFANSVTATLPISRAQLDAARTAVQALVQSSWSLYSSASAALGLPASQLVFTLTSAAATRAVLDMIRARISLANIVKITVLLLALSATAPVKELLSGANTSAPSQPSLPAFAMLSAPLSSSSAPPPSVTATPEPSQPQPSSAQPLSFLSAPTPSLPLVASPLAPSPAAAAIRSRWETELARSCQPQQPRPAQTPHTALTAPLLSLLSSYSPELAFAFTALAGDYWEVLRQVWGLVSSNMLGALIAQSQSPQFQSIMERLQSVAVNLNKETAAPDPSLAASLMQSSSSMMSASPP